MNNVIVRLSNLLLVFTTLIFAGKEMTITPVAQEKTLWCWAACCEMISHAYKFEVYGFYGDPSQTEIAQFAVNGRNEANNLSGSSSSVDNLLFYYGGLITNYTKKPDGTGQGKIDEKDLTREIDQGRPIIAAVVVDKGQGAYLHDVLIKGYTGTGGYNAGYVIYNDPERGVRGTKTYADFLRTGNSWAWYETLRIFSDPREPIPEGLGPHHNVTIDDNYCTKVITETTRSLTYYAGKSGDSPVSWEWKLSFPLLNGETYVAASWTTNTSQYNLTWNISNFTLPANYDWKYTYEGKIGGKVEVTCMDPDYHHDAINILYIPNDLYPGVLIYKNKTINNSQSDVRAHEFLITQNDNFSSGANISLKSGERIDIVDGITIENGGLANFIVDPALR